MKTKMIKTEECKNCAYYKAFYREGIFSFWVERQGLCSKCSSNIVEENDTCEYWEPYIQSELTTERLDIAIEDIKALKKIYKKDNFTF